MSREERLASTFAEMADALVDDFDIIDFLQRLAGHCVGLLEVSSAALMLSDPWGTLWTVAASDEDCHRLGAVARRTDESPCAECYRTGTRTADPDLTARDARWPRFAEEAARLGFRGAAALPLRLRGEMIGALGLLRRTPGPFADEELHLAQALADSATVGLLQQRTAGQGELIVAQLRATFGSWVVVEQAKGVLAELWDMSPQDAVTVLRRSARERGMRLTDLADAVLHGSVGAEQLRTPPVES